MNILALDTSTKFLCIGLEFNGRLIEFRSNFEKKHSEILIPILDRLLKRARLELEDFDFFCVGCGPGSFTGLRIGMATIKGFALSLKKPVIGIPSLDILANNISSSQKLICPIIDARRNQVFSALYRKKDDRLKKASKYLLISVGELLKKIEEPVIFLGDGLFLYQEILKKRKNLQIRFASPQFWYPKPGSIISLAKNRIEEASFDDPDRMVPLYLYPKECQIRGFSRM